MRIGYGRVSGPSQTLDSQRNALAAAGCSKTYLDTASGKLARRPELDKALLVQGRDEQVSLEGVMPTGLLSTVVDNTGRVENIPNELCVLIALREAIRRREVDVVADHRWRDPDADMPADFESNRDVRRQTIRQTFDPSVFVTGLQGRLHEALGRLDEALAGFTDQLTSVASREITDRATLWRRLVLVWFGLGANVGAKAVAGTETGETKAVLRRARPLFVNWDGLRRAIRRVVNATLAARDTAGQMS